MEKDGNRMISVNYCREDYLDIHLSLESNVEDWERALKIFDDRIGGRYFKPIDVLIWHGVNQNGFAIMALNCLLVETLYQFYKGIEETGSENKKQYSHFLHQIMPDVFCTINESRKFYDVIRCGILHSAQTKNGSQLTFGKPYIIEKFESGKIRVDVGNFTKRLREYYWKYCNSLQHGDNISLRENFISKMNFICMIDET